MLPSVKMLTKVHTSVPTFTKLHTPLITTPLEKVEYIVFVPKTTSRSPGGRWIWVNCTSFIKLPSTSIRSVSNKSNAVCIVYLYSNYNQR